MDIQKISDTEIQITTSVATVVSLANLKAQQTDLLGQIDKLKNSIIQYEARTNTSITEVQDKLNTVTDQINQALALGVTDQPIITQ